MDERFEQLGKGLAKSPDDAIGNMFGTAVADDVVTDDSILFAKVVCHDQKKRGGSLSEALAFVDMWHERFGRVNFYGASLATTKALVAQYWDNVTYPDPELEQQYYDMVARIYY